MYVSLFSNPGKLELYSIHVPNNVNARILEQQVDSNYWYNDEYYQQILTFIILTRSSVRWYQSTSSYSLCLSLRSLGH